MDKIHHVVLSVPHSEITRLDNDLPRKKKKMVALLSSFSISKKRKRKDEQDQIKLEESKKSLNVQFSNRSSDDINLLHEYVSSSPKYLQVT